MFWNGSWRVAQPQHLQNCIGVVSKLPTTLPSCRWSYKIALATSRKCILGQAFMSFTSPRTQVSIDTFPVMGGIFQFLSSATLPNLQYHPSTSPSNVLTERWHPRLPFSPPRCRTHLPRSHQDILGRIRTREEHLGRCRHCPE